jgi:hypothetical protein
MNIILLLEHIDSMNLAHRLLCKLNPLLFHTFLDIARKIVAGKVADPVPAHQFAFAEGNIPVLGYKIKKAKERGVVGSFYELHLRYYYNYNGFFIKLDML